MKTFAQPSRNESGILSENKPSHVTNQFHIQLLERMQDTKLFQENEPERLKIFEIIWVKNGKGVLIVDLQEYKISKNTIYCLAPGQYRLLHFTDGIEGYHISLPPEFLYLAESHVDFSLLLARYSGKWNLPVTCPDAGMEEVVIRIHKEYNSQHSLRSEILKGLLKVFMIYLSRQIEIQNIETPCDKDAAIVRKFMTLLKTHFTTKKLVADYADELCISPNYLNSIVKRLTGFPVSHHIQQHIIMEAKRQAMYSGLRMKEVADKLGFDDYAHFSKFFKNYSGINFSSFKKGILKNNLT